MKHKPLSAREMDMAQRLSQADYMVRVLLARLGNTVEITGDEVLAAMGNNEIVASSDPKTGNFVLTLVTGSGVAN